MDQALRPRVTTVFNSCIVEDEQGKCISFPKYQHTPLTGRRTIRLLKVEAPTRPWRLSKLSEMYDYTLFDYELEDTDLASLNVSACPYVAMSYSWGEPVFDSPLMMMTNGQRSVMPITASAWEAVQRTLPGIGRHGKLMWIDQICINQDDEREKGRQVALMGEIYRRCWHCMIWLGHADGDTKAAFDLLNKLQASFKHTQSMPMEPRQVADLPHSQIRARLALRLGSDVLPPSDHFGWVEIAKLLQDRDWFNRLWIFQEAVLCYQGDASVRCGYYSARFITFIRAAILLGNDHSFTGLRFTNSRALLMQISEFRFHVEHQRPTPLVWLLENNDSRKCRNPSDRIYALLGLQNASVDHLAIDVDYKKPPSQLFIEITATLIKSQQSLRICADCPDREHGSDALELPLWVPDWTQRRVTSTFELYSPTAAFFKASSGRAHTATRDSEAILVAEGKAVDVVESIIGGVDDPDAVNQDVRAVSLVERVIPRLLDALIARAPEKSYAKVAHTVVNVLTVGGYTRKENLMDDSGVPSEAWSEEFCGQLLPFIFGPRENKRPQVKIDPEAWKYVLTREVLHCVNRKFALLNNHLLALVSTQTIRDDLIVILHGSSLPFVLRPSKDSNYYTLIGSCYVHGIMHGESVD